MLTKALLLFASQVSRESQRIDMTVIRVLYMGFLLSLIPMMSDSRPDQTGLKLFQAMTVVHAAMAVLLAVRLAGDVAGDRASGLVGLLYLSGVESKQVVLSRLLLLATTFLSVWLIRVPTLVLAYHLGGTTLHQMLQVEALLVGQFCMTVSAGLLLAHYSPDRAMSRLIFLLPAMLDFGLTIPSLLVAAVHFLTPYHVPLSVESALGCLRYGRTTTCLFYSLRSLSPSAMYLCPLLLHVLIAGWSLWAWRRVYFTCLDEAEVPATADTGPQLLRRSKSKSRPSRPVWDDGLAWQAYYVHSDGARNLVGRAWLIGAILAGTIFLTCLSDPAYRGLGIALLVISTGIMMFVGRGKVSDCLQKEIKEKTLPSLLLTPYSALELCDGWARGAWKLMLPDLILYAACCVAGLLYAPMDMAPILCGGAILVLASGPFLVLSPLVPFSPSGICSGLGLIAAVLLILCVTVPLSIHVHPWLGPLVLLPLAWGWNWLCRQMIPSWFARKQEDLA